MTDDITAPDVVDNEVTDVLAEDEVVQVPPAAAELAESLDHPGSTFVTDVPHWDADDESPPADHSS
jgi:hypothetical protein